MTDSHVPPAHLRRRGAVPGARATRRGRAAGAVVAVYVATAFGSLGAVGTVRDGSFGAVASGLHALAGNPPAVDPAVAEAPPGAADVTRPPSAEVQRVLSRNFYRAFDADAVAAQRLDRLPLVLGDVYTHYLKPETYAASKSGDDGRYVGVGINVAAVDGRILVVDVVGGSSADRAGVRAGDRVTDVDQHDVARSSLPTALSLLHGQRDSSVVLGVERGGRPHSFVLRRQPLAAQLVTTRLLHGPAGLTGYIKVDEFDTSVGRLVREAADQLRTRGARAFVLDLRADPGGLASEAVELVSAFVPQGTPVYRSSGLHEASTVARTQRPPVAPQQPVTVLVDQDTASAAEITAAALQDAHRATVLGSRTFGKGVMQKLFPLQDGGALKVTVAEWITPAGQHLDRIGLLPDGPIASEPLTEGLPGP